MVQVEQINNSGIMQKNHTKNSDRRLSSLSFHIGMLSLSDVINGMSHSPP